MSTDHTPAPWPTPDTAKFGWGPETVDLRGGVLSLADYLHARECVNQAAAKAAGGAPIPDASALECAAGWLEALHREKKGAGTLLVVADYLRHGIVQSGCAHDWRRVNGEVQCGKCGEPGPEGAAMNIDKRKGRGHVRPNLHRSNT